MTDRPDEDTSAFPALGRLLLWVDRPGSATRIIWGLAAFGAVVFAYRYTYKRYGDFAFSDFGGFYAVYGFVMFTLLILAAKGLRVLIRRDEDYYGDKAIDREAYPADQLDKVDHDA